VHIPDGYLSPIISVGLGVVTVPTWSLATRRVQRVLTSRTIPLLAIFAAMAFTIMMFNVPVPGGTTAHGVGGTLIAIVLGPWAAVIAVSVALIIQALFFGDGGVLAIFANCLNMGIVLPFVGYATYRVLASRSPVLSARRIWAAGIGAYVGITVAALCVGIELGIQPLLFSQDGVALYSPYGLAQTIPAMLIAHALGASIVEALITAFGVAYLQKRHPEYLASVRDAITGSGLVQGVRPGRPLPQVAGAIVLIGLTALAAAGLVTGGGDPARAFGADWGLVDWAGVATMLVVVAVIAAIVLPLSWYLLPRRMRTVGTAFLAAGILAPLGLIAPGIAFGESGPQGIQAAFGYVPQGLQHLSGLFSAPFAGYTIPLPFLAGAHAALWQTAIGYELAGILGMLVLGLAVLALARAITWSGGRARSPEPARSPQAASSSGPGGAVVVDREPTGRSRIGWLEHTLAGITGSIERAVFTEEHARSRGWLQAVDPRAKLGMFLAVILAASLASSIVVELALYGVVLLAAAASRVPFSFFVKRVWLGIPLFAAIVVIPAIFFVPGPRLFDLVLGPLHLAPSVPGLVGAVLFVTRVAVSVSLAVLLVLTTPWADLLKSLQAMRAPRLFVLVLAMAYRYIFLFLHLANGIFEARKSRIVARTSGGEQRRFISGTMGNLVNRSVKMSNDVYAAMAARGFSGSIRTFQAYRMHPADWWSLAGAGVIGVVAVLVSRGLA
jgi:cobalt ECF transporter T component CbiQ/cobalamin biosynthesis protein CbiM